MRMETANFVTKKSLTETFRRMRPGEVMIVKNKDFKYSSGRTAMYNLKREGIMLRMTEKGMVDCWKVERIK